MDKGKKGDGARQSLKPRKKSDAKASRNPAPSTSNVEQPPDLLQPFASNIAPVPTTSTAMAERAANTGSSQVPSETAIEPVRATRKARTKRVPHKRSSRVPKDPFTSIVDPFKKFWGIQDKLPKGTGLVFHISMGDPECLWDKAYPECPARFFSVIERCRELGLLDRCVRIDARPATKTELLRAHSEDHIELLKLYDDNLNDEWALEFMSGQYDAIYFHPSTYNVALLAAGSTINLVDAICSEKVTNGIAIVRPPGHHAMHSQFNGYCFLNNVGIAAKHAIDTYKVKKILIVDWDVHHGQGTQQMFYDDKRVLYFSIHRYQNGSFWPNLAESDSYNVGTGAGKGYNINVPLNETGLGNTEYMAIFQKILLPIALEYQPELILVSAGYDAAIGCPEGEMEVTPVCYAHLLWSLMGLAEGKIAVILEGGYCLQSLAEGVALTLRSLLGDPCPIMEPLTEAPHLVVKEAIVRCIVHLYPYWQCFQAAHKVGFETPPKTNENLLWPFPEPLNLKENVPPFETRDCYPVVSSQQKAFIESRITALIRGTILTFPTNRVCYAYELEETSLADRELELYVERPARIIRIHELMGEFGVVERCMRVKPTPATKEMMMLVHDEQYIDWLIGLALLEPLELWVLQQKFVSVALRKSTFASVAVAVGCLIKVVEEVCSGASRSGVAVIRPPGHHAEHDCPSGFCMVNNVAIAVRHAQKNLNVKKILIVDWDVHHGNGTQHMFYDDPNVLVMSIHRYDKGKFFPKSTDGNSDMTGNVPGQGRNVNIPWDSAGMHDGDYTAAFTNVVLPIAYEFQPELVVISAGFDAAVNDPIGKCKVSPEAYGLFTHWLSALANGRVVIALEGGYNGMSVSSCVVSCTKALLGDPLLPLEILNPSNSGLKSIYETIGHHIDHWASLRIPNSGENARQIIEKIRSIDEFSKGYSLLTPEQQVSCIVKLESPEPREFDEPFADAVMAQFNALSLISKP